MTVQVSYPKSPTYVASVSAQANTAAAHALVVEASATRSVRILKVCITQPGLQTTAGVRTLLLERTTAAGDDGAITAETANAGGASLAKSDGAAFGGIVRAKPTTPGTQGATIVAIPVYVPAAVGAFQPICIDFTSGLEAPPRIPKGTANGIALRDPGAAGAAGFAAHIVFAEE